MNTRWLSFLAGLCVVMTLQGVLWMVVGSFDPWGIWDRDAARFLYGEDQLPEPVVDFARLVMIPFGATDAGFFAMATILLWRGARRGHRWALDAFAVGFTLWFLLDTVGCVWIGAWFNVWMVNLPAAVMVGVPLLMVYRDWNR